MIKELPGIKATVSNDIPVSAPKESFSAYYEKVTDIFDNCTREGTFPEILKKSEATPVFKKGDPSSKTYYRPVSTLSNFSKIFEKFIYLQLNEIKLNDYMRNKFSIYLAGFRKKHGTQHSLLKMIETWKTKRNMGHKVGVIYTGLSKAFDSLNHELLIAKLKCYGPDQHVAKFFRSYLSSCCKCNNTLGDCRKVKAGLPQRPIPGPFLLNIFLNIFFFLKDANRGNCADDSTLYGNNKNLEAVICNLRQEFYIISLIL